MVLLLFFFHNNTSPSIRGGALLPMGDDSKSSSFAAAAATPTNDQDETNGHPAAARLRARVTVHPTQPILSQTLQSADRRNPTTTTREESSLTLNQILYRAGIRGLGGGLPGAIAGALQVVLLMWLRTIINYQCRYGTTFGAALRTLLAEGGIARLYRGVWFALVQAPLARFVSTAANDGVEALLAHFAATAHWGPGRTTVVASIVVGCWRMLLMRTYFTGEESKRNDTELTPHFPLCCFLDSH